MPIIVTVLNIYGNSIYTRNNSTLISRASIAKVLLEFNLLPLRNCHNDKLISACCENIIGLDGAMNINGDSTHIPLATA